MSVPRIDISDRVHPSGPATSVLRYLTNRWVLLGIGTALLVAASALNWGWPVAAGIAPIIISLAPCAIMCGLGLCGMKMMGGGSCHDRSASPQTANPAAAATGIGAENEHGDAAASTASCCATHDADAHNPTSADRNEERRHSNA